MKIFTVLTFLVLFLFGCINIISSFIWTLTQPQDHWLWFSRFALGTVLLGISIIISLLYEINIKK